MGYTTYFDGAVEIAPALNEAERDYLRAFSETRRMNRERGPYFVGGSGFHGQGHDPDVTNLNQPPAGQPGLWCHWVPDEDGGLLLWDESEKFYEAEHWMAYHIDHFLRPGAEAGRTGDPQFEQFSFDHILNGEIEAQGEDPDDKWLLRVTDNAVTVRQGVVDYSGPIIEVSTRSED